ncbi:isochorismatase family protein [Morganella morganii]|uniref:isochorismatase family protein n=1 Tax=Morganella morganii TaxID=582 RepID=UPI001C449D0E|nr:isochorismatase family protein [Morganella morganii]QXO59438.1 isochorismatase family protein [Morganella morganii]QXO78407.1 isochorismatase family protein [Morganella morganii]
MKQALIIIDLINDITGKHGLSNACHEQTEARHLIAATRETARQARLRAIPVIWIRVGFADDWHDIPAGSPMFQRTKEIGALKLSGSGCDWAAGGIRHLEYVSATVTEILLAAFFTAAHYITGFGLCYTRRQ